MVLGGTGTVGSQVARELLARGAEVFVLTRGTAGKQPPAGAKVVQGDLLEPATARTAFDGMDGLFLINAVSTTEAHEGLMAVCGAREAGVGRIAYLSVHAVDQAAYLPHFGAKIGVEAAVATSGIAYTILRPNNFYQNDYWYKDAMLQYGVYPQPVGEAGLSRVDVRDIAEAATIALTSGAHDGETYNVVGPEAVTGSSTAATWSAALGRQVGYAGDDLERWEEQNLRYLPAYMVYDFKLMYAHFQRHGLRATAEDVARVTRLLGHPPRRFADFARETAAAWGVAAGAPA
jgi:uncharacterized protein YbjT (DUF2867 family)